MSDEPQYKIVFTGRILDGFNIGDVKKRLFELLKSDRKKIEQIFAEAPVTLKKNIDYPTASKYKEALRAAGAACEIQRAGRDPGAVKPPAMPPAARGRFAAGDADTAPPGARIRPGKIWYVIAALLIIVPPVFAGIRVTVAIFSHLASGIEFSAPGTTAVTIQEPDKYIIWYTTDDGRYQRRDIPGDIRIAVYDQNARRRLEVRPPGWQSRETVAGVERQSIAEVVIERAGIYTIEVNGDFPKSDLMMRRSLGSGVFTNIVIPVLIGLAGFFVGLTTAVVVLVRRSKMKADTRPQALSHKEERQWAMFSHFGTFAAFVIPFGNIIVPLVIWQIKKNESSYVVAHSKASLNFQISLMIYSLAATLLVLIIIGIFLLIGLFIFNLIVVIMAGVKANEGQYYRYPMAIRFFG
jgi:uncharacterized Tic20 family protein